MTRIEIIRRTIKVCLGLFIFAFGAVLTMQSNIGMSPWFTLSMGISYHVPFSFGTVHTAISLLIVVVDLIMHESVGIGTLLDAILVGYYSDFIIATGLVPVPDNMIIGIIMTLAGLVVMAVGQYFYMSACLGCGPRDTLFIAIGKRLRKMSIGVVQTIILVVVFGIGWLLGAQAGVGTLIAVFLTGTTMEMVFKVFNFDPRDLVQVNLIESIKSLINNK